MSTRWWTFGVWAAVAASALYWGFRLFAAAPPLPREAQLAEMDSGAARGDLTRLLGAEAPPAEVEAPVADARFQLIGVVSPHSAQAAHEGLALIAVDGKSPKVFRVGAVVEGQHVLQAVSARSARLGLRDGAAWVVLNLTPPAPATTGMLPVPGVTQNLGLPPRAAGTAQSLQSLAPAQGSAFQTQQELFHQRQQIQFQQEQMQNQGPDPVNPPPLPKGDPQADLGNLR